MFLNPLHENAKASLENFQRTLETTTEELDFVPEEGQFSAARLVERSKSQLPGLEAEWNTLRKQQSASDDQLKAFISRLEAERGKLSILVARRIHRQNLGILQSQLARQQSALTTEQLQATLRPQMDFEVTQIDRLQAKKQLDSAGQELLRIHRNNLEIYETMLSGQRPFAPLHLVNSVALEEQAIQKLDHQLAGR